MPPQTDPRAPPCERSCNRRAACPRHRVWATLGRDGAPIPTQRGTGGWLADAYSGAAAAPQGERGPRGSPVVRTREPRHLRLPNAPSTLNDGEKQRQQPCPDSKAGSPATHSRRGEHPRPPLHPHGRPETARAQSCPPTHMLPRGTREAVLVVVPARPYSVPVQRLGVATRRWLGSSTALRAKPST